MIVEFERGVLYKYSGNYFDFLEKKVFWYENEIIELEKSWKLMKKELEWIWWMFKVCGIKVKFRVDVFDGIKEKVSKKI